MEPVDIVAIPLAISERRIGAAIHVLEDDGVRGVVLKSGTIDEKAQKTNTCIEVMPVIFRGSFEQVVELFSHSSEEETRA